MYLSITNMIKKPSSFEVAQKTGKSQMPSSFYWMKENITHWPGTAVQSICRPP